MKNKPNNTKKCEKCGAPGKLRKPNWFGSLEGSILCDKCYEER